MIRERLLSVEGVAEVKALAAEVPAEVLLDFIFDTDARTARNAAWSMTHKKDFEVRALPQDRLIDLAMTTQDGSLRRLVLSLVERQEVDVDTHCDFLDFCLEHMASLQESVGVQSICMKLAYRMSSRYDELHQEFLASLRLMPLEMYKPGVAYLIKKLLKTDNK